MPFAIKAEGKEPVKTRDFFQEIAELLWMIALDPHEVGVVSANWSTQMLAAHLNEQTRIKVTEEMVHSYLSLLMATFANVPPEYSSAKPKSKPIAWETPAGRDSLSRYHSI